MAFIDTNTGGHWTDAYVAGSFRGVEFHVDRDDYEGGRELVEHKFIDTDDSHDEDIGKRKNIISLTAYLIGDDFYNKRNDLIEALEKEGEGVLIHPYYGEFIVKVPSFKVGHTVRDGRMCTVDITFKKQKTEALVIYPDSAFDKLTEAKSLFQQILQALATAYDFASQPIGLMDDMLDVVDQCIDIMEGAKAITGLVDEFQAKLDAFKGKAINISFMAESIWTDLEDLIDFGADVTNADMELYYTEEAGKEHFNNLKNISDIQNQTMTSIPSIGDQEGAPTREFQKFISRLSLASRAGLVATMEIKNTTEADAISKDLDAEIRLVEEEDNVDDDLYAAAQDLRVAVRDMLAERKLSLKELTKIELDEFKPGIVMSYDLYNDIDRDIEIARMNDILHPGFILGKRELIVNEE